MNTVEKHATVIATFSDRAGRLSDGTEQPYLVLKDYSKGKVLWIGSGETWRLRSYKKAYHERFWIELAKYVGAGAWKPRSVDKK